MRKILVVYDSGYGATTDAAETIAATLVEMGISVDLRTADHKDMDGYAASIIGSPIRLGQCTPKIKKFLKKNTIALASMPVTFFFTCMSVTDNKAKEELPLYIDPSFNDSNKPKPKLKLMENNHTASYYLTHFLKLVPNVSPLGIAFFKGRLNMANLTFFHRLIMRFAMFALPEIQAGDYLNKAFIRNWAEKLSVQIK